MESYLLDLLNNEENFMDMSVIEEKEYHFLDNISRECRYKFNIYPTPNFDERMNIKSWYLSDTIELFKYIFDSYVISFKEILKERTEEFTVIPVHLYNFDSVNFKRSEHHSIVVIFSKKEDLFYILDPSGVSEDYSFFEYAKNKFFPNNKTIKLMNKLQFIESKIPYLENELDGYCHAWSALFIKCFLLYHKDKEIEEIIDCILNTCNNDSISLRKLVRIFSYEQTYL